ncbi:MAG: UDP-N-acetyl glucosamine 2-epimerase, partial [Acidobacteriota bacterium]
FVICFFFFTTDRMADEILRAEGVAGERIHFVGNVMIDTLLKHREMAGRLPLLGEWGLRKGEFATLTLHRPSNVDDREVLGGILEALAEIARELPIVFPVHPRTRKMIAQFGYSDYLVEGGPVRGIWTTAPLGYLEFLHLNMNARMVLTDSGGLQEETTVLGVPCITMRNNTERPVTCEVGTNQLVGNGREAILAAARGVLEGRAGRGSVPEKWDGRAAERIVEILGRV